MRGERQAAHLTPGSVRPLRPIRLKLVGFTRPFLPGDSRASLVCSRRFVRSLPGMPVACSNRTRRATHHWKEIDNHQGDVRLREPVSASVRRSRLRGVRASMLLGLCGGHRIGCLLCPLCRGTRRNLAVLRGRRSPLLGVSRASWSTLLSILTMVIPLVSALRALDLEAHSAERGDDQGRHGRRGHPVWAWQSRQSATKR